MKRICLILTLLMIVSLCGTAMAEEKIRVGQLAVSEGLLDEDTILREKLPVEGTFFVDYQLEYDIENGKYKLRSFSTWNLEFVGTLQGDFMFPLEYYADYAKRFDIADAVGVECNLNADGLATVTFSYRLKRTQADGTTIYMEPMTTVTTLQLPAE